MLVKEFIIKLSLPFENFVADLVLKKPINTNISQFKTIPNITPFTLSLKFFFLNCQNHHNMSAPSWLNETVFNKLKELESFSFYIKFGKIVLARLKGGK